MAPAFKSGKPFDTRGTTLLLNVTPRYYRGGEVSGVEFLDAPNNSHVINTFQRYDCSRMSRTQVLDFTRNLETERKWTPKTAFSTIYYKDKCANAPIRPYSSSAQARYENIHPKKRMKCSLFLPRLCHFSGMSFPSRHCL